MKKPVLLLLLSSVGLIFAMFAAVGYLVWNFQNTPGSPDSREIVYEIPPGKSFQVISEELTQQGVVRAARAFSLYARFTGERAKVKAGEYLLRTSMTPNEVLSVITSGKSVARPLTISEGLNLFEIAALYERGRFGKASDFMAAARDQKLIQSLLGEKHVSLEGYLFPETYQLTRYTTARDLVTAMVTRFLTVWSEIHTKMRVTGFSRHQLVTLASIVEKETGAPEERPLISSVFHNRMVKKMRLQTDPTIIYGMAIEQGSVPKNITRADIMRPTAYNTYVIAGLPPGPIANPGREALLAAGDPVRSEYFYFVSRNNGTHVFSVTYAQHEAAVRDFQMNARAREGKSWRDLNAPKAPSPAVPAVPAPAPATK